MSENYLQHADHFSRVLILQDLNKSKNDDQNNVIEQDFKKKNEDTITTKAKDEVIK